MHYCRLDFQAHLAECSLLDHGLDFQKVHPLGFHAILLLVRDSSLHIHNLASHTEVGTTAGTRQVWDRLHLVENEAVV